MRNSRCTIANESSIGKGGQRKLESACVGVAGLGGVGGIAFELLVRAGVGRIRVADGGFFEESNANRQSLWTKKADGMGKADAAAQFASDVNPGCKIKKFGEIKSANSFEFASGCSSVIDATDRAHSRLAVWSGCCKAGVPYVFASALGTKGMLTVFAGRDFEKEFGVKGKGIRNFLSCDHSLGPVTNAIGCLAAQQALNTILGEKTAEFPEVVSIDAFSARQAVSHSF